MCSNKPIPCWEIRSKRGNSNLNCYHGRWYKNDFFLIPRSSLITETTEFHLKIHSKLNCLTWLDTKQLFVYSTPRASPSRDARHVCHFVPRSHEDQRCWPWHHANHQRHVASACDSTAMSEAGAEPTLAASCASAPRHHAYTIKVWHQKTCTFLLGFAVALASACQQSSSLA
jgi:hypothetical protein